MGIQNLPRVSVVIPAYNEEKHIRTCIEGFLAQEYPPERLEVIIADGRSSDHTRDIVASVASEWPQYKIHLVDNPGRTTPHGLNAGIQQATGDVIVIFGAHAVPSRKFVPLAISTLQGKAAGVNLTDEISRFPGGIGVAGGRLLELGLTPVSRAIGAARNSPIGGAISHHRCSTMAGLASTVPYGAYRREVFDRVGLFDTTLVRDQDDEFNYRVRKAGYAIYYNPEIQSTYIPRSNYTKLAKQLYQYGYWKPTVLARHHQALSLYFFAPPLFVASLAILGLTSLVAPVAKTLLTTEISLYLLLTVGVAFQTAARRGWKLFPMIWVAYPVIHCSVGIGMLVGIKRSFLTGLRKA